MVKAQQPHLNSGRHADRPGAESVADAAGRNPPNNPAAWSGGLHDYGYRGDAPGGVTLRAAVGRAGAPMAVTVIPCDVTRRPDLDPELGRAWQVTPRGFAPAGAELRYTYLAPGDVLILSGDPRLAGQPPAQPPPPPVPEVPTGEPEADPAPAPAPEAGTGEADPVTDPAPEAGSGEADPVTDPAPDPLAGKVHRACGYRYGTIGHRINCEGA
jgi:hypothetical protein